MKHPLRQFCQSDRYHSQKRKHAANINAQNITTALRHISTASKLTFEIFYSTGILSGGEIQQQTWWLQCQVSSVKTGSQLWWLTPHCRPIWSYNPTSQFPSSSMTPVVITEPFFFCVSCNISQLTAGLSAVCTCCSQVRAAVTCQRNEVWQTMSCVSAATSRQCHISLIPACWLNSTVVYNVYTLQTKMLLIDWCYMTHRSIQN